ncbi:lysine--tRNA ligase [Alphaproteobacteria bacterium]|nr:lysine--tRNA ligase [Alphaproteobacteria bacterium]
MTDTDGHDQRQIRVKKYEKLLSLGINPYPVLYKPEHFAAPLQEKYASLADDTTTADTVKMAGRIRAVRNSGMFIDMTDETGKIQVYCDTSHFADPQSAQVLELIDLGDIIGVEGVIRRTKRRELTVDARRLTMLSKSLLPPPEKRHGLQDVELRYRRRYLDFLANEESKQTMAKRSRLISELRRFLDGRDYMEFETPILQQTLGGANARPFTTHHNALDIDLYLRIATELHLKRLIVGGFPRVYEIGRIFRNEGMDIKHNPEFTTLELYQAYGNYESMMEICESVIRHLAQKIGGGLQLPYGGRTIDYAPPFRRVVMTDIVKEATGIDFLKIADARTAAREAEAVGVPLAGGENWGQILSAAFEAKCEHTLIQPTHVFGHPVEISPLAKRSPENPRLTERFETFVNAWEVANAFSELSNPIDQRERLAEQVRQHEESGDAEAMEMDDDFVMALEYGMPPTGGIGIGIDRITMLLTDSPSIRDVIAFPTMRPEK